MGRLIAVHAFSQLLTNPLLAPEVYNSDEPSPPTAARSWNGIGGLKEFVDWVLHDEGTATTSAFHSSNGGQDLTRSRDRPKRDPPLLATYNTLGRAMSRSSRTACCIQWLLERPAELFAELREPTRSS